MKRSLLFAVTLISAYSFTVMPIAGCNTFKGLGEDTEELGEEIQEEADE